MFLLTSKERVYLLHYRKESVAKERGLLQGTPQPCASAAAGAHALLGALPNGASLVRQRAHSVRALIGLVRWNARDAPFGMNVTENNRRARYYALRARGARLTRNSRSGAQFRAAPGARGRHF